MVRIRRPAIAPRIVRRSLAGAQGCGARGAAAGSLHWQYTRIVLRSDGAPPHALQAFCLVLSGPSSPAGAAGAFQLARPLPEVRS